MTVGYKSFWTPWRLKKKQTDSGKGETVLLGNWLRGAPKSFALTPCMLPAIISFSKWFWIQCLNWVSRQHKRYSYHHYVMDKAGDTQRVTATQLQLRWELPLYLTVLQANLYRGQQLEGEVSGQKRSPAGSSLWKAQVTVCIYARRSWPQRPGSRRGSFLEMLQCGWCASPMGKGQN